MEFFLSNYSNNLLEAVQGVDGIVILTDWEEFKGLNYSELYKFMRKPSWLFDCRGVINKKIAEGELSPKSNLDLTANIKIDELGLNHSISSTLSLPGKDD